MHVLFFCTLHCRSWPTTDKDKSQMHSRHWGMSKMKDSVVNFFYTAGKTPPLAVSVCAVLVLITQTRCRWFGRPGFLAVQINVVMVAGWKQSTAMTRLKNVLLFPIKIWDTSVWFVQENRTRKHIDLEKHVLVHRKKTLIWASRKGMLKTDTWNRQ